MKSYHDKTVHVVFIILIILIESCRIDENFIFVGITLCWLFVIPTFGKSEMSVVPTLGKCSPND